MKNYYCVNSDNNQIAILSDEKAWLHHGLETSLNDSQKDDLDIEFIKLKYPLISQGITLFKIYDSDYWKGYKTFGDYCKDQLGITANKAKQLITCSRIALLLLENGISDIPKSLSIYNTLACLEDDNEQASIDRILAVWNDCLEMCDKIPNNNQVLASINHLYPDSLSEKQKEKIEKKKEQIKEEKLTELDEQTTNIEINNSVLSRINQLALIADKVEVNLDDLLDKILNLKPVQRYINNLLSAIEQKNNNTNKNKSDNEILQLALSL